MISKKCFIGIALLLAAVCGWAQENNYSITVENLPLEMEDGTKVTLLNWQLYEDIDTAMVADWEVRFTGHTDTTFVGWITNSHSIYLPVVVEPGMDFTIDFSDFTVSGSHLNVQLYRFVGEEERLRSQMDESWIGGDDTTGYSSYKIAYRKMEHLYDSTGWTIHADNSDNIVGAYILGKYYERFVTYGYYYSDTLMAQRNRLDSLYNVATPAVRGWRGLREWHEKSIAARSMAQGRKYADFEAYDFTKWKTVRLSEYIDGHVAVLDFWASWCGPCRQEINEYLKPLYAKYAEKGLVVVSVGVWDEPDRHKWALFEMQLPYPHLLDTTSNNAVAKLYGFHAIPQVFLIDRDGMLLGNFRGEQLVSEVEKALGVRKE